MGNNKHGRSRLVYDRLFRTGVKNKPLNLARHGYRLTARYVIVGGKYKIFELLPLDSAHEAEVSFLTPDIKLHGVIIPNAYHEHKARLKSPASRFIMDNGSDQAENDADSGPDEKAGNGQGTEAL